MRFINLCFVSLVVLMNSAIAQDIDPTSDPNLKPIGITPASGYYYELTWSDEFNGSAVDEAKWNYRLENKNVSAMLKENNRVSDGLYRIDLKKESINGKEYTCGGIISKRNFRYGFYETSLRVPKGAGWHTSFWMMHHGDRSASHIELDPFENDSIHSDTYKIDAHQWSPDHERYGDLPVNTPTSLSEGFHMIGLEFTPDSLRYYYEGELTHTLEASGFEHNDVNIWLTSLGFTNSWNTPSIDDSALPSQAQFEYARFFKLLPSEPSECSGADTNSVASKQGEK